MPNRRTGSLLSNPVEILSRKEEVKQELRIEAFVLEDNLADSLVVQNHFVILNECRLTEQIAVWCQIGHDDQQISLAESHLWRINARVVFRVSIFKIESTFEQKIARRQDYW